MTRRSAYQQAREEAIRNGFHEPQRDASVETEIEVPRWPDPPGPEAFHGVFGRLVQEIEPHTEADPMSILAQALIGFGNLCGRKSYALVESSKHYPNLFGCLVGRTGRARKGTSWQRVRAPLTSNDITNWSDRIESGLSSGEGLIWAVRDEVTKDAPIRQKGRITSYQKEVVASAVLDKRLLVVEEEFSRVLAMGRREGNILAAVIRQAWDTGRLRSLVKTCPAQATDAHISIIGHITQHELLQRLGSVDAHNGFLNRFLWFCVERSKSLPRGGGEADLGVISLDLASAAEQARRCEREIPLDPAADQLWRSEYDRLTADRPGLAGEITGRTEAQTLRLALIYALADESPVIGEPHLRAALAVSGFVIRSAFYTFGSLTGDSLADEIETLLREHPLGVTQTEIVDHFSRNKGKVAIHAALQQLLQGKRADWTKVTTGKPGRPANLWKILPKPPASAPPGN